MAKLYLQDGTLGGEERSTKIALQEWVTEAAIEQPSCKIFPFLTEAGKYFNGSLSNYPQGVSVPSEVRNLKCHANNILYAALLNEKHPQLVDDFQFVSGFYAMKAKISAVPANLYYYICHHSFMLYKGNVLDCTILHHPPLAYEVDQYFGIAFKIETIIKRFDELMDDRPNNPKVMVLETLLNEPYIK
jgi:hypothetical protein